MFQQFYLYIIIGLMIALLAVGGTFAVYHRIATADIKALSLEKATLTELVKTNERTIEQMIKDANKLAETQKKITNQIISSEMKFVDEWSAINSLDLESDEVTGNPEELERTINAQFKQSIEGLKATSGSKPCAVSSVMCGDNKAPDGVDKGSPKGNP